MPKSDVYSIHEAQYGVLKIVAGNLRFMLADLNSMDVRLRDTWVKEMGAVWTNDIVITISVFVHTCSMKRICTIMNVSLALSAMVIDSLHAMLNVP